MTSNIKLIVRADDAGSCWSSNMGCLQACTDGIATSVEVMIPCPWTAHAAQVFAQRSDIDIGLHLTLTSEWDAVKWRPLTHAPSLVDEHGNFLPLLVARDGDTRPSLDRVDWSIDEIAEELRAQVKLGRAMFPNASHVSSHMLRHFADLDPQIGQIITDLCAEFSLLDDPFGHGLPRIDGYPKFPRDGAVRAASLVQSLSALTAGTYIFIDHPAVHSDAMSDIGHPGYKDVMEDRTTCLAALTDVAVKQCIKDMGIELIGYRDL